MKKLEFKKVRFKVFSQKRWLKKAPRFPFYLKKTFETTKGQIEIDDEGLTYLIDKHCRESGVRNLQKKIQRIFRKSAIQGKHHYFYKWELSIRRFPL